MKFASLGYLPPPSYPGARAFYENIICTKHKHELMLFSEYDWAGSIRLQASPEIFKQSSRKLMLNNSLWFTALRIALLNQVDYMIYIESDCRVGAENWDGIMLTEALHKIMPVMAGTVAFHAPKNGSVTFVKTWEQMLAKNNKLNFPVCTYGNSSKDEAVVFVNGALGVYHVPEIAEVYGDLLRDGRTMQLANNSSPWDLDLGTRLMAKRGLGLFAQIQPLSCIYSGFGEQVTTEKERQKLLMTGQVVAVHQINSDWQPTDDEILDVTDDSQSMPMENALDDLTVAITSFQRDWQLKRAIDSARAAGIKHVVVSTMKPSPAVLDVLESYGTDIIVDNCPEDLGCNELWLRAAYYAKTEHILLLHDDDFLAPEFGDVYCKEIAPAMANGRTVVTWRSRLAYASGKTVSTEYHSGATRTLSIRALERIVLRFGTLSLSPIITIFKRSILISAVKEAGCCFTENDCLYRPGMLLGTEILAHLRNCNAHQRWRYIDKVLSNYGADTSSGTVHCQVTGTTAKIIKGYDIARAWFVQHRHETGPVPPRLIFVHAPYSPKETVEVGRIMNARWTWDFHFAFGELLELAYVVPYRSHEDNGLPYVKDMIDAGVRMARPEDIVVLTNSDICLTTLAVERIKKAISKTPALAAIRRTFEFDPDRLYQDVLCAPKDGGYDLFAMTPAWWQKHRDAMPDMILGRQTWDWVLRTIMANALGPEVYVDNLIYHKPHNSAWQRERKSIGQLHNIGLAKEFFTRLGSAVALKHINSWL